MLQTYMLLTAESRRGGPGGCANYCTLWELEGAPDPNAERSGPRCHLDRRAYAESTGVHIFYFSFAALQVSMHASLCQPTAGVHALCFILES